MAGEGAHCRCASRHGDLHHDQTKTGDLTSRDLPRSKKDWGPRDRGDRETVTAATQAAMEKDKQLRALQTKLQEVESQRDDAKRHSGGGATGDTAKL